MTLALLGLKKTSLPKTKAMSCELGRMSEVGLSDVAHQQLLRHTSDRKPRCMLTRGVSRNEAWLVPSDSLMSRSPVLILCISNKQSSQPVIFNLIMMIFGSLSGRWVTAVAVQTSLTITEPQ